MYFALLDVFHSLFKAQCRAKTLARDFLFAVAGREVLQHFGLLAPLAHAYLLHRVLTGWRCVRYTHTGYRLAYVQIEKSK